MGLNVKEPLGKLCKPCMSTHKLLSPSTSSSERRDGRHFCTAFPRGREPPTVMASALVTARSAAPAVLAGALSRPPPRRVDRLPRSVSPEPPPLAERGPRRRLAAAEEDGAATTATTTEGDDEEEIPQIEIPERPEHVRVVDAYLPAADAVALRGVFETHNDDPRRVHEYRFVWDYWHVPGQYTQLRTPAADYFPQEQFEALEEALLTYARETLGCSTMTPVWLSNYVDGMRQEIHADVPHGPFAFVLSLTNWDKRRFTGGETFLLRPETLDYWRGFETSSVVEPGAVVQTVEPEFNRLTVFDPRIPHGVDVVEGHGRSSSLGGAFSAAGVVQADRAALLRRADRGGVRAEAGRGGPRPYEALGALPRARGVVVVRVNVDANGRVTGTEAAADTLVRAGAKPPGRRRRSPCDRRLRLRGRASRRARSSKTAPGAEVHDAPSSFASSSTEPCTYAAAPAWT